MCGWQKEHFESLNVLFLLQFARGQHKTCRLVCGGFVRNPDSYWDCYPKQNHFEANEWREAVYPEYFGTSGE